MRALILALACALTFALVAMVNAYASADSAGGRGYVIARVRCAHPAEDTLAHVRLIRYVHLSDGSVRVVYQCKSTGY